MKKIEIIADVRQRLETQPEDSIYRPSHGGQLNHAPMAPPSGEGVSRGFFWRSIMSTKFQRLSVHESYAGTYRLECLANGWKRLFVRGKEVGAFQGKGGVYAAANFFQV
jgi:hypothetical protein